MKQLPKNNKTKVSGALISDFVLDHQYKGNSFYKAKFSVRRRSGSRDVFYIMVPEWVFSKWNGSKEITVLGEIRTRRNYINGNWKLFTYIYVHKMFETGFQEKEDENNVFFKGTICKQPIYRTTFNGIRIADTAIAVNRPHGKCSYIPCVVWGKGADLAKDLSVGSTVCINGRFQSRIFKKKRSKNEKVKRCIAYEVSVYHLEVLE